MILTQKEIDRAVTETLPQLPEGHTNAVVGLVDQQGVKFAALLGTSDGKLSAKAYFEHDWDGENKEGVELLASW